MIVIPMAGLSSRFFKAGYTEPKYKLLLNGETVFSRSVKSFSAYFDTDHFIFVVRNVYETEAFVRQQVEEMGISSYEIICLDGETEGQADTVFQALVSSKYVKEEPLFIFNIDTFRYNFKKEYTNESIDGYLEVFYGEGDHWSFALPQEGSDRIVVRTTEKDRISDLCSNGLYFFRNQTTFIDYFSLMKEKNLRIKGELYIAPMYNLIIQNGGQVYYAVVDTKDIDFCGTPAEYEALLRA